MAWSRTSLKRRFEKLNARLKHNPQGGSAGDGEVQVLDARGAVVYSAPSFRQLGMRVETAEAILKIRR